MKTKLYHCLLVAICLFAACKKDDQAKKNTTPASTQITDSVSYTINGKNYVLTLHDGGDYGTSPCNLVYDPVTGRTSKDADSIMFFKEYSFKSNRQNRNDTVFVAAISFFRKYSSKSLITAHEPFYPVDQSAMYAPGNHTVATDFIRTFSTNGVAIYVARVGRTYSYRFANQPTTVTQAQQANSSFVVTSLKPIDDQTYWLEAKFNVTLFNDDTEEPIVLKNGYVRMKIQYAPFPTN